MMECKKVKYASKKMADEDIARIRNKSRRKTIPIRSYQCTICPEKPWHLTSKADRFKYTEEEMENKKIAELVEVIKKLKEENASLRSIGSKEIRLEAKVDERIKKLNDQLSKNGIIMSALRRSNSELIAKIVQLEKLIQKDQVKDM